MDSFVNKQKQKTVDKYLAGQYMLIHASTAAAGVLLPPHLKANPSVTLRISKNFRKPLTIDADGISIELLFAGEYSLCKIPWDALWGATSLEGESRVWSEAVPAEIADVVLPQVNEQVSSSDAQPSTVATTPNAAAEKSTAQRPKLTKIEAKSGSASAVSTSRAKKLGHGSKRGRTKKPRGKLKLVTK